MLPAASGGAAGSGVLRAGLCALIGGFGTYMLLTLGIGGLEDLVRQGGTWFIVEVSLAGMLIGWVAALLWWMAVNNPSSRPHKPA